jgi:hypothetical protein
MDNKLYAKVDFETSSQHGWSNNRGYGVIQLSNFDNGKIMNDKYMYNRIQPLKTPFGDHFPKPQIQGYHLQLNPQTDLGWATNFKN